MSERRVLGFKPALRPEWRGQDGQDETEQGAHNPLTLGDSLSRSMRMKFSVHTTIEAALDVDRARAGNDVADAVGKYGVRQNRCVGCAVVSLVRLFPLLLYPHRLLLRPHGHAHRVGELCGASPDFFSVVGAE